MPPILSSLSRVRSRSGVGLWAVGLVVAGGLCGAGSASAAAPAALAALVEEARQESPGLSALEARAQALEARAVAAGAWPDPVVAIEYSNAPVSSLAIGDHMMGGLQLTLQQTLRPREWSGLMRDVGLQDAVVAEAARAEAALVLDRGVREAWWRLTQVRLLRVQTESQLTRLETLLGAVRVRYETGGAGQHAVLRVEGVRDRLADELGDFARLEAELIAALQGALSTPAAADGADARQFPTPETVSAIPAPADADWRVLAATDRPAIAAFEATRAQAASRSRAAQVDGRPDVTVWGGYRIRTGSSTDPGEDLVSVGVGVPLPIGSRGRSQAEQAAQGALSREADARREAALDGAVAAMGGALARWRRAVEKAHTYETALVPQARATLDGTLSDFAVGRADFGTLMDAEMALIDLERARIVAATETWLQHAAATAVLGAPPPEAP